MAEIQYGDMKFVLNFWKRFWKSCIVNSGIGDLPDCVLLLEIEILLWNLVDVGNEFLNESLETLYGSQGAWEHSRLYFSVGTGSFVMDFGQCRK